MTTLTRRQSRCDGFERDQSGNAADHHEALRGVLEKRMERLVADGADSADPLGQAMRASTLSAGKRMRPLLLMLVARDLGCRSPAVVDVACAVEMVHAASLILDDMPCMDDAMLRRGKPTIHRQFGQDVAILASIALLSRAFCILANAEDIQPAVRARLVATLAQTVGAQGLVKGQFQDLHGARERSVDDIATTNELKTGVLLGATVDMAAILAGADERTMQSLRGFGMAAGHAFQIRDDFQDVPGNDSAVTGKDTGKDLGKATFISTLGYDEARRRLMQYLRDADRHLSDAVGSQTATRVYVNSLFARGGVSLELVQGEPAPGSSFFVEQAGAGVLEHRAG
jgi:geranylgeranyl diphosphate synthase type II